MDSDSFSFDPDENAGRRTRRGVDPSILLERSFLQWNMIDSIANAIIGWLIICTYLFWRDPVAEFISITGITFFIIGLFCYADIFGVLLYKTNYFIMVWQKRKHPPFPDLQHLKKLGWIANIIWFVIMLVISKISFDVTYETLSSFIR